MPPNEFEAAILKEPDFSILEAPKLETAAEQKHGSKLRAPRWLSISGARGVPAMNCSRLSRCAAGCLPRLRPTGKRSCESLWENPKARRLFRKTAKPLDRLREGLQEAGFEFDVPADMLTAIDERSRSGKMMFATKSNAAGRRYVRLWSWGCGCA